LQCFGGQHPVLRTILPIYRRILQPFGGQHPVLRRPPCAVLCPFTGRLLSSFSWRQKATLGTSLASNASGRRLLCQDHGTDARAPSSPWRLLSQHAAPRHIEAATQGAQHINAAVQLNQPQGPIHTWCGPKESRAGDEKIAHKKI